MHRRALLCNVDQTKRSQFRDEGFGLLRVHPQLDGNHVHRRQCAAVLRCDAAQIEPGPMLAIAEQDQFWIIDGFVVCAPPPTQDCFSFLRDAASRMAHSADRLRKFSSAKRFSSACKAGATVMYMLTAPRGRGACV